MSSFRSVFFLCCILLFSCKSGFEHSQAGMEQLNKELKEEFGAEAWYTSIELENNGGGSSDDIVTVDQTSDPNSLKQEQWTQFHGFWEKKANITLSIKGAAPKSFMFQLDKEVSLPKLGALMEQARKTLEQENKITDAKVVVAQIKASNQMNTKEDGIYYSLSLKSKAAGKSFLFVYDISGMLKNRVE